MSIIHNEPKYKFSLIQQIRGQLEQRAIWLYLLTDEAKKRGLDPEEFSSAAITRCGLAQGADLVKKGGTDSLIGLRKTLFTKGARMIFEMTLLNQQTINYHLISTTARLLRAGRKWAAAMRKSPCFATLQCAATTTSASNTALLLICRSASQRATIFARFATTNNLNNLRKF